jgi:hypothetical protein
MRSWLTVLSTLLVATAAGCGARDALVVPPGANGGGPTQVPDAGTRADANDAGDTGVVGVPDGRAPIPECMGENSACVMSDAGDIFGASIIKCDGVNFVGPWNLLLERLIGTQYQVVQQVVVMEPGFGATIEDNTGPPQQLTYRVCAMDSQGPECGTPFTTFGPVDCKCLPFDCKLRQACNKKIDDGCGDHIVCGGCPGGTPCNDGTCCPPGFMPDLMGGCVCAPTTNCGCGWWNTKTCECD